MKKMEFSTDADNDAIPNIESSYVSVTEKDNAETETAAMEIDSVDNDRRPSTSSDLVRMKGNLKRKLPPTENELEIQNIILSAESCESRFKFNKIERYPPAQLKKNVHGVVYQLKHLMQTIYRASKIGDSIRLATEMEVAGKFDDVVLEYTDRETKKQTHRFVQLKHSQKDNKKIGVSQLITFPKGLYSIQMYFKSWSDIKNRSIFGESEVKKFILCTNSGLDVEGLRKMDIKVEESPEKDEFLDMQKKFENFLSNDKRPKRYKITVEEDSDFYRQIKREVKLVKSDVFELAERLAKHFCRLKSIKQKSEIFNRYYTALVKKNVVVKETKKFTPTFITEPKNLSDEVKAFRDIFFQSIKQLSYEKYSNTKQIQDDLKNFQWPLDEFLDEPESEDENQIDEAFVFEDFPYEKFKEFLSEFTLAVSQPNEEELGKIIVREMGDNDKVNLLEANLVKDSFQNNMLNWLKSIAGIVLEDDHLNKFFQEIKMKLCSLRMMGICLNHLAELKGYGIRFSQDNPDLNDFLNGQSDERILKLVSREQTLLTALRVSQTIEKSREYKKQDSYIFISLEELLQAQMMDVVLLAFENPSNQSLLIINCESMNGRQQNERKLWNRLNTVMENDSTKKIILIMQGENNHSDTHLKLLSKTSIEEGCSFKNLNENSQQKLLKKKLIKFQGQPKNYCFEELLRTDMGLREQKLEDLSKILNVETLIKLIRDEEVIIGNKVEKLGNIQDYYLPRKIVHHVIINISILKDPRVKDHFAISGVEEEALRKLIPNHSATYSGTFHNLQNCTFLSNRATDFEKLCKRNKQSNIHWLHYKSDNKFHWKKSRGDISNLVAHIDESNNPTPLTEGKLLDLDKNDQRIVIISNVAGMGKSTLLTYLMEQLKKRNPEVFVIRMNLGSNAHSNALYNEFKKRKARADAASEPLDFLVQELSGLNDHHEKQLLKIMIEHGLKVALIFDGFDEIDPEYRDIVIEVLQEMARLKVQKIFVTTRPNTKGTLECNLMGLPYSLNPFDNKDQKNFLNKFWKSRSKDSEAADKLLKHTNGVLKLLEQSFNHHVKELIGIPLQTRLVAEAFEYNPNKNLPKKIDIIELYRSFVDRKLQIQDDRDYPDQRRSIVQQRKDKLFRDAACEAHQELAVDALFKKNITEILLPGQPSKIIGDIDELTLHAKAGIFSVISGKAQFNHQTYAEYFAALFFANKIKQNVTQEVRDFFIGELLLKPQYKMIRIFLNALLAKSAGGIDDNIQPWNLDLEEYTDTDNRTVCHVAVEEESIEILKFLASRLDADKLRIDAKTRSGNDTPLHNAVSKVGNVDVVTCLIENEADIECENSTGDRPLHAAVRVSGNLEIVKYLIENRIKKARVDVKNKAGDTPLQIAEAVANNSKVINFLKKNAIDRNRYR